MSLNRNEKAVVVSDVAAQAAKSQTLALAEYRGLTVEALNKLRVTARAQGVYLHVLKNTLARRAVAGTPFEAASESMVGPLIYGFSEDAVAAAKVIADFAKTNDKLVIKGGAYGGKALDVNGVKALAASRARKCCCRKSPACSSRRCNAPRPCWLPWLQNVAKAPWLLKPPPKKPRLRPDRRTTRPTSSHAQSICFKEISSWHSIKTLSWPRWTA